MALVTLNYFAGARAVAGTETETVRAASVREALELAAVGRTAHYRHVLDASSLLLDGIVVHGPDLDRRLDRPVQIEILPPFAGG